MVIHCVRTFSKNCIPIRDCLVHVLQLLIFRPFGKWRADAVTGAARFCGENVDRLRIHEFASVRCNKLHVDTGGTRRASPIIQLREDGTFRAQLSAGPRAVRSVFRPGYNRWPVPINPFGNIARRGSSRTPASAPRGLCVHHSTWSPVSRTSRSVNNRGRDPRRRPLLTTLLTDRCWPPCLVGFSAKLWKHHRYAMRWPMIPRGPGRLVPCFN